MRCICSLAWRKIGLGIGDAGLRAADIGLDRRDIGGHRTDLLRGIRLLRFKLCSLRALCLYGGHL